MALTKEEYQDWAAHPLTQKFHQYLTDYREALKEKWARGEFHPQSPESVEAISRCQMAQELTSLDDDSIANFYNQGA